MSFLSSLSGIFASSQKGLLKNVLTGAGVSLTTGAVTITAFNAALILFQQNLNSIAGVTIALLHLSGSDIGLSIIISSVVTRLTLNAAKLNLTRAP